MHRFLVKWSVFFKERGFAEGVSLAKLKLKILKCCWLVIVIWVSIGNSSS